MVQNSNVLEVARRTHKLVTSEGEVLEVHHTLRTLLQNHHMQLGIRELEDIHMVHKGRALQTWGLFWEEGHKLGIRVEGKH